MICISRMWGFQWQKCQCVSVSVCQCVSVSVCQCVMMTRNWILKFRNFFHLLPFDCIFDFSWVNGFCKTWQIRWKKYNIDTFIVHLHFLFHILFLLKYFFYLENFVGETINELSLIGKLWLSFNHSLKDIQGVKFIFFLILIWTNGVILVAFHQNLILNFHTTTTTTQCILECLYKDNVASVFSPHPPPQSPHQHHRHYPFLIPNKQAGAELDQAPCSRYFVGC